MKRPPPRISDHEIRQGVDLLKRYPAGLKRDDLDNYFTHDRGRRVMAAIAVRGIAFVVNVDDPVLGNVYRIAKDAEEEDAELRRVEAYIDSLEQRREGLMKCRGGQVREAQGVLF